MENILNLITAFLLALFRIEPPTPRPPKVIQPEDGAETPPEEVDEDPVQEPELEEEKITSRFHWILNAGHGPKQSGKHSPPLPEDGYVFYEWEYNHDIVRRVCAMLEEKNISYSQAVHLHPELGQSLQQRTDNANNYRTNKKKRYVSVHANAGRMPEKELIWLPHIEGTETFIHPNAVYASREMANCFNDAISKLLQSTNRGIKTANFHELRETKMPACLLEIDFYTNPEFVRISRTEKHRQTVADTIVGCILELEAFSS